MLRRRAPILNDAPSIAFGLSDDECVQKLALLIEHRDNKNLDEIVALIARLAVPIEGWNFQEAASVGSLFHFVRQHHFKNALIFPEHRLELFQTLQIDRCLNV
jgi:hypothetical protein